MKRVWMGYLLASLVTTACVEAALPKKPTPTPPIPHDLECVVRVTAPPVVVGTLYASRNGTEYMVIQFDRNHDQHTDLVLLYPRVGLVQYRPFPTVYFVDADLDGVLDLEYRDQVGDGLCRHFTYTPLKKGAPHEQPSS